jgi:hypothetical protein
MSRRVIRRMTTDILEEPAVSVETSVYTCHKTLVYTCHKTQCHIPEDSVIHSHRHENLIKKPELGNLERDECIGKQT